MKALVTGSAGHLGEAMMRTLQARGEAAVGMDIQASPFTQVVASITDRDAVARAMLGVTVVYHTATLHKPHVATHTAQDFIDTNVTGTLVLLEAAVAAGVRAFIFTSTTSAFGHALRPPKDQPAAWVTEEVRPVPRNIYGVTKTAAEDLCELWQRTRGLPCIVLRTSRFFPEEDDDRLRRQAFDQDNLKVNEFLYRRVEIEDVVEAHFCANAEAERLGFGRYIISATTPILQEDLPRLQGVASEVVAQRIPQAVGVFTRLGWKLPDSMSRVYVNTAARRDLGWRPKYDFAHVLERLDRGDPWRSPLAEAVGSKGYHDRHFEGEDGPYPVEAGGTS